MCVHMIIYDLHICAIGLSQEHVFQLLALHLFVNELTWTDLHTYAHFEYMQNLQMLFSYVRKSVHVTGALYVCI